MQNLEETPPSIAAIAAAPLVARGDLRAAA